MNEIINQAIDWIEAHEHTVDFIKWLVVGLGAWALGVFRAIRNWTSRPFISINPAYSHCYYDVSPGLRDLSDVTLLAFVLDIEVFNPTNFSLAVRSFDIQIRSKMRLRRWNAAAKAVGFPSMPRTPMPSGNEKIVPLWFTTFEEYGDGLSLRTVGTQDSGAGLAFFAVVIANDRLPKLNEECLVRVSAKFVSGSAKTVASIKVRRDLSHLERMVPGGVSYVRHPNVWTKSE